MIVPSLFVGKFSREITGIVRSLAFAARNTHSSNDFQDDKNIRNVCLTAYFESTSYCFWFYVHQLASFFMFCVVKSYSNGLFFMRQVTESRQWWFVLTKTDYQQKAYCPHPEIPYCIYASILTIMFNCNVKTHPEELFRNQINKLRGMISVTVYMITNLLYGVKHHFQQYSVISWRSILLVEETGVQGETTNFSVRKVFPDSWQLEHAFTFRKSVLTTNNSTWNTANYSFNSS